MKQTIPMRVSSTTALLAALLISVADIAGSAHAKAADIADRAEVAAKAEERAALQAKLAQGAMSRFHFSRAQGEPLETTLIARTGGAIALSSLRGAVVLVNVWASWCAPCRDEMVPLARLAGRLASEGLIVVALNIDRKTADADRFLDGLGIRDLTVYLDPEARAAKDLAARGVPVSILIDRQGREIGRIEGAVDWISDEAILLTRSAITGRIGAHSGVPGR